LRQKLGLLAFEQEKAREHPKVATSRVSGTLRLTPVTKLNLGGRCLARRRRGHAATWAG